MSEIEAASGLASFFPVTYSAAVETSFEVKAERAQSILGKKPKNLYRPLSRGHRWKVELQWQPSGLGISRYVDGDKQFTPFDSPPEAGSMLIGDMIQWVQQNPLPMGRANLRFREGLGPIGGLWIDGSNFDVKSLLDEQNWILAFKEQGWHLEIGQKAKGVLFKKGRLGLGDPTPRPWLPSFYKSKPIPLASCIASFSQPGPEINRMILKAGQELFYDLQSMPKSWMEWGAGYGNLTASYASFFAGKGISTEAFGQPYQLLEKNRKLFFPHTDVLKMSAERSGLILNQYRPEVWILDPPRPGFSKLLENLKNIPHKPRYILNLHCHEQGLQSDTDLLKQLHYDLLNWSLVDSFPGNEQAEVISLWSLKLH